MTRIARILAVTSGLFAAGAAAGALAGAAVAGLVVTVLDGPRAGLEPALLRFGATFGAAFGAVLLPVAGWLLMRHVPLGRALLGTAVGTVAGGLVGWFVPIGPDEIARTLVAGVVGFVLAVLALRRTASAARSSTSVPAV